MKNTAESSGSSFSLRYSRPNHIPYVSASSMMSTATAPYVHSTYNPATCSCRNWFVCTMAKMLVSPDAVPVSSKKTTIAASVWTAAAVSPATPFWRPWEFWVTRPVSWVFHRSSYSVPVLVHFTCSSMWYQRVEPVTTLSSKTDSLPLSLSVCINEKCHGFAMSRIIV